MSSGTILCLASFEKGFDFMRKCHENGWRVLLLTGESLKKADWPMDVVEAVYCLPDPEKQWNLNHMVNAVSYLARSEQINRIVALDDFDVEKAAVLREHLRVDGMGDTTARNFRDKLAMRGRAEDAGIAIPRYVGAINHQKIAKFLAEVPAPYVLKPRFQANAIGIVKCENPEQVWKELSNLGDEASNYVLEEFVFGDICHVDSIIVNEKVVFACTSRYGTPPMEVFHGGRVFTTRTVPHGSEDEKKLLAVNAQIMTGLGLKFGVSHTEFIYAKDGRILFLETSARVGGAHIADMVIASTGVNLWEEWANLETLEDYRKYKAPKAKKNHAALMVTLSHFTHPDMSSYNDKEIAWKLNKKQHAGLIIADKSYDRITELLEDYVPRFYKDFFASVPAATSAAQMS